MSWGGRSRVRTEDDRRVHVWAAFALAVAVAGAVASVWRPFAPALAGIGTDLDVFDPAVLASVEAYRSPRTPILLVATVLAVAVPLLTVVTARGRQVVRLLAGGHRSPAWRAGLVAFVITLVVSIVTLPLAAWSRLVHDARWEFRTQTAAAWLGDWSTVTAARAALVGVAAWVAVAAARRWPRSWPYRLTLGAASIAAVGVMLHPVLLLPAILPTEPLSPTAAERVAIDPVLRAAGEPDLAVYVAEESRRSTRVNALATGLGPTARIIVYDNLLELPVDQVASVVAHEIAHHQHRDLLRGVLLVATGALPALLLVRRAVDAGVVQRRVDVRGAGDPRSIGVALLVVAALQFASQPVVNVVSRNLEAAADARAMAITGDPTTLIASTRIYTVRDLSDPDPPGWLRVLSRTHPSVGERVRQAVAIAMRDGLVLPSREVIEEREADQLHPSIVSQPS